MNSRTPLLAILAHGDTAIEEGLCVISQGHPTRIYSFQIMEMLAAYGDWANFGTKWSKINIISRKKGEVFAVLFQKDIRSVLLLSDFYSLSNIVVLTFLYLDPSCYDSRSDCAILQGRGDCQDYASTIRSCPVTCGACRLIWLVSLS